MKNLNSFVKGELSVVCSILLTSLISLEIQGQSTQQKAVINQNSTTSKIEAPGLIAPANKAVLTNFPRETKFQWKAVPGAKEYEIQVEINEGQWRMLKDEKVAGLSATIIFPADNPGRWRVRAIDANGSVSIWSGRTFLYYTSSDGTTNVNKPADKTGAAQTLAIPQLLGPADGASFSEVPRKTKFDWGVVEGANEYQIEVEYKAGNEWKLLKEVRLKSTSLTLDFVGAQPGRWRVCAVADNKKGPYTKWSQFSYTR